jgi:hypothetical protein
MSSVVFKRRIEAPVMRIRRKPKQRRPETNSPKITSPISLHYFCAFEEDAQLPLMDPKRTFGLHSPMSAFGRWSESVVRASVHVRFGNAKV